MASDDSSIIRIPDRRAGAGLQARYYRMLRTSRLLRVAFWTTLVFFLVWAVPWLPGGLSEGDYDRRTALTLILSVSAFGLGTAALLTREWLQRLEEALGAYSAVYDSATGLYNRRYFLDRLTLECDRSHRLGNHFSVIVFRLESAHGDRAETLESTLRLVADEMMRQCRASDVVAVMGSGELALALLGVDKSVASDIGGRFRSAIAAVVAGPHGAGTVQAIRVGVSEYPGDGSSAAALMRVAHECLSGPETVGTVGPEVSPQQEAA